MGEQDFTGDVVSGAASEALTMFTFEDLVAEIAIATAKASEKESWHRLNTVAEELAKTQAADESFDPVTNRRWSLIKVSVRGYRGVLNQTDLTIDLDPRPGITVLHGPNGAGKSSISDAIEAALTGKTSMLSGSTGGNFPLWEPVPLGRGSESANAAITLASGEDRLHLSFKVSKDSAEPIWTCELESNGARTSVELGVAWSNALASHRPVFAYATLERRVQLSKDLAGYFENLLALGGAFNALDYEISERKAKSQSDFEEWRSSLKAASDNLKEIDNSQGTRDIADMSPIQFPAVDDDVDAWVMSNELSLTGPLTGVISTNAASRLRTNSDGFRKARKDLNEAGQSVVDQLAPELEQLHNHAERIEEAGGTCPVCQSPQSKWRDQLARTMKRLESLDKVRSDATTALEALIVEIDLSLRVVLDVEISVLDHPDLHNESATGKALVQAFDKALSSHGTSHHHIVIDSAEQLSQWIQGEGAQELVVFAAAQADRFRQWKLERAAAAAAFIHLWRQKQPSASQALQWKAAQTRVEDLRKRLRARRTSILETRASSSVQELLADVGLRIGDLVVQKTKATMQLLDTNGKKLELGMLSAGQRNAVLLAPLLASIEAGPFGFVVLDDPVHAFDQLRIDRLAKSLTVLAADRRVIVLTHDERLREHIMARPIRCETRMVGRSASDGAVTVTDSDQFWDRLLKDAQIILDMTVQVPGTSLSVTDTVRGLCRQALDNAIREMVVRWTILSQGNLDRQLKALDRRMTTRQRLSFAEELLDPCGSIVHPVSRALQHCDSYLNDWNRASHGNPAESEVAKAEIDGARSACIELAGSALFGSAQ